MDTNLITPIAILIGAALIGGAIVVSRPVDRYEIFFTGGASGDQYVWRLNSMTGEIKKCEFHTEIGPLRLSCSP